MIDQQQPEKVEHFSYVGSMITNGARYRGEIKSRIVMAKATFNKKNISTSKLFLNLTNKLPNCYI